MPNNYEWNITENQAGVRLDTVLSQEMDISRSAAQQWLEQGLVTSSGTFDTKMIVRLSGKG